MRGLFHRALVAAAASVAILAITLPSGAFASGNGISAPDSRLPTAFALDLPVLLPSLSSGPQDLSRYAPMEVSAEFALMDGISIETDVNVDVARVLDRYVPAARSFDGLFYSSAALNHPYASLSSGGTYSGMNLTLSDGLHLSLGRAFSTPGLNPYLLDTHSAVARLGGAGMPYDTRDTSTLLAGVTWNFAKWGGVGFSASQTTERGNAFLPDDSGLAGARVSSLAVSAHVGFGGGWTTSASYSEGEARLDLKPIAFGGATSLHSQSYGISVAKHGLFGNDTLGVAFSRPAPNYAAPFTFAGGNDVQFLGRDKLFNGTAPEADFEVGYTTNMFHNTVALQANAAYQTNFGGQNGANAVSLLSRAKIKF